MTNNPHEMTHGQRRRARIVYESSLRILRREMEQCRFCQNTLQTQPWSNVTAKLRKHALDCPVHIVIEAALNTESEGTDV